MPLDLAAGKAAGVRRTRGEGVHDATAVEVLNALKDNPPKSSGSSSPRFQACSQLVGIQRTRKIVSLSEATPNVRRIMKRKTHAL